MKISLWFLIFLLSSCAHVSIERQKEYEGELTIKKAQNLYDLGEIDASISSLQLLVDNNPYHPTHDQAYELLIKWLLEIKRYKEAKKIASYFLANHQNSESADRIVKLFHEIEPKDGAKEAPVIKPEESSESLDLDDAILESQNNSPDAGEIEKSLLVDKKALGILLPLSGTYAPFGKKVLTAMGMAWEAITANGQDFQTINHAGMKIIIADTKGEAETASKMAKALILDHQVSLIIGEITTDASLAAAKICEQFSVPMLSLSRDPSLSNLSKYVFIFNSSPYQQIAFLVDRALKDGHKKFGILFPKNNYGTSMSQLFHDEVVKRGAEVTALENYEPSNNTFFDSVKKLAGTFNKSALPVVNFDALFIPEFQKLSLVVPALVQQDILVSNNPAHMKAYSLALKTEPKFVKLLGLDSWNDITLLKKIAPQVEGAYFVDSMSFDQNDEMKGFAKDFLLLAKVPPTQLEVFAHDAAKLAEHLIKTNDGDRASLQQKIAQISMKIGLLSNVSFLKNGELDAPKLGFSIKDGSAIISTNDTNG